ncbi:MAG: metalloregulator ArsR/SmtB family transcription factor [Verrucomicrobiales bacterium]|nr:metalloregulator ArsR/SmtB family transcription factor [Verrucomicrobiales bacterium]
MGVTRTDLFSDSQNAIAMVAKALAHPARVAIIEHLLREEACINGDLVQELGLAQATISQHLRELKDIGIIQGTIDGTRRCYCINAERWADIQGQFNALFDQYHPSGSGTCC